MNCIDIMDAMNKASARLQDVAEYKVRCVNLRNEQGKCGTCFWWMKSSFCPREKNVNGRNKGPSRGDLVMGCPQFYLDPRSKANFEKEQQWLDSEKERLGL
jgi:hypothetical protein